MSNKQLSENELVEGVPPYAAHSDDMVAEKLDELGLEVSESDYKAALKRIEPLFDAAKPGTP